MEKLAILVAVLAMFIFVESISAYRTTVTTVEIEDGEVFHRNKQSQTYLEQRCRHELQKQQVQLDPCENYVNRRLQEGFLSLRGVYNEDVKQQCCQQLEKIRIEPCQCHAIKQVAERLEVRFKQTHQKQKLKSELLENLPQRCDMPALRQCDISDTGLDF